MAGQAAQEIILGVFEARAQAQAAIVELRELGLDRTNIMVIVRPGAHGEAVRRILERYGAREYSERFAEIDERLTEVPIPGD